MAKLEVTDHAISLRPETLRGNNYPTWGLSIGDKPIGTVWETPEGYAGQIQGTDPNGEHREYACPVMSFRQTVIDELGKRAESMGLVPEEPTYKVIRFFERSSRRFVIKTGLTLALAQAHCEDPETSSSTCTNEAGKRRTRRSGRWFDGWTQER